MHVILSHRSVCLVDSLATRKTSMEAGLIYKQTKPLYRVMRTNQMLSLKGPEMSDLGGLHVKSLG